jgi:hypothetical protein
MLRRSRGAGTAERTRSLSPDRARRAISRSPSRLSRTESEPARGSPLDDSGCPPRGVLVTPLAEVNRLRIEPMSPLGHLTLDEIHQVHHRNSRVRDRIAPSRLAARTGSVPRRQHPTHLPRYTLAFSPMTPRDEWRYPCCRNDVRAAPDVARRNTSDPDAARRPTVDPPSDSRQS